MAASIAPEMFQAKYADATAEPRWDAIEVADSALYPWRADSTYIQQPPFFQGMTPEPPPSRNARALEARSSASEARGEAPNSMSVASWSPSLPPMPFS